jgi:hypothetical protein
MLFLLGFTILMELLKHVILVIFVKAKPPFKPLAHPGHTPPQQDPLHALNVHPGHMPTLLVLKLAKFATVTPTNLNPILQNAFQSKKDTTNRAQRLKSFVQRVNPVPVATQSAKSAWQERSRALQVKLPAATALTDGAIPIVVRRVAMLFHLVLTRI